MASDYESPFHPVVKAWQDLISRAEKHRYRVFGRTAKVCRNFFDGAHDFMYKSRSRDDLGLIVGDGIAAPSFMMSLNKVAELVQIFGPTLYHANPYRHVLPRQLNLSMDQLGLMFAPEAAMAVAQHREMKRVTDQAVAELQAAWLNYTPGQLNLKGHSRLAIDEALITGRGVLWHEMYRPGPNAPGFVPYSYHGSCDDLGIDPDAETLEEATFIFKKCQEPRWRVEREYGLREGVLKKYAKGESSCRQGQVESAEQGIYRRKQGVTADTVTYYKIWSKCGMGHELSGPANDETVGPEVSALRQGIARFGDHVFLVVCEGCDYFLNLPPEDKRADGGMYSEAEVWERTRWPVPFYEDSDGWPCSLLDFHPVAKCVWPMAHFKPALGEMMAANWIYSFLLGRLHFTSRTLIFYADHLGEEIKAALESGKDLELIPYQEALVKEIDKLVQQFQHAPVPMDLWRILAELNILIDKRTGLSETLYGMTDTQPRSATESQVRQSASNIRPASMADTVEDWQTKVARAEAFMSRLKVPGNVVSAYMGETGPMGKGLFGELWDRFVYLPLDYTQPQNTARAALEFEYTIAAGSSRKPNIERDQVNMDQAMQTMLPMAETERQMTGDPTMTNWLLSQWAKSRQIEAPLFPDRTAEIAMQQQMAAEQAAQMPVDETGQPMVAA